MLLTLPALIPALPFTYVLGASIWNLTDADGGGGPTWPVTLVYTLMVAGVAGANVWLLLAVLAVLWRGNIQTVCRTQLRLRLAVPVLPGVARPGSGRLGASPSRRDG
jgi:hypothetical protein